VFDINPLRLISSGMMVMTIENKDELLDLLAAEGINAVCIGRVVEDEKRRVIISDGNEEEVTPPESDELFNIKLK
jgi:hydrogenase expression/formation protein HypE